MLDLIQKRILLVDDNSKIHDDFRKVLNQEQDNQALEKAEEILFGKQESASSTKAVTDYLIDSAYQGQEALELVLKSIANQQPYALAFIDIRMPPGWDGIETIKKLWQVDPELQVVICSAHSDYSWEEMSNQLANTDNFLVLKKPFELIEIRQLAAALTKKWELRKRVNYQIENLNKLVDEKTADLNKSNKSLAESLSIINATLESTQEGILAVCRDETPIVYNNMFIKLWNISDNLLKTRSAEIIFQQLANQIEESQLFLATLIGLCKNPKNENIREWKLKSGKVLELYSHPRYIEDKQIGTVFSFRDITDRKQLEEQLLYQATHDSLTKLPNRILLGDRIQQAILQSKRHGLYVGVLVIDLDNFKQVNDSLGHNAGDILLQTVSKRLLSCVREADTVIRLGGDEFVMVLASLTNEEELIKKAKQILELFLVPSQIENHQLTVTVSIGISIYPRDGHDPDTLLKNADAALYHAKGIGRNTFQFYMTEFNDHLLQRAELTTALRLALPNNELALHYQPLIELNTDNIIGVEALLRWDHPTLGVISPNVFIPLAEETGLIVSIGEWVLRKACQQAKLWQKTIDSQLHIAVNISAYQFRQKNFIEMVRAILKETALAPHFLEIEITESLVMENSTDGLEKMSALKALGVNLSVDDFGTGYASLSYVKNFPFDKIKIDKSFVNGVVHNSEDRSIVEAIINMTKSMGLQILAEGVEQQEQVDFLRKTPNAQVQGYYFSPALEVNACTALLEKHNVKAQAD